MDRPAKYAHVDINESILYSASILNLHGLPYDYASLKQVGPPDECGVCNTHLVDPKQQEPLYQRLFTCQSHAGRCGGDGRCIQAHEVAKLAVKRLV